MNNEYSMFLLNNPSIIDLEITANCNVICSFCPRSNFTRPKGSMDKNIFKEFYKWIPEGIAVSFSGMGEPLMNKDITYFIRQLKEKNVHVVIKTNGLLLNKDLFIDLLNSGVMHIQVSIPSGNKKTYESLIKGASFQKLIDNINEISDIDCSKISFHTNSRDENELNELSQFAASYKIPLYFGKLHSRGGYLYIPDSGLSYADIECRIFAKAIFITWDGKILSCCHDLDGNTMLGNIRSVSYLKIKEIKREKILNNNWFPICLRCDDSLKNTYTDTEFGKDIIREFVKNKNSKAENNI